MIGPENPEQLVVVGQGYVGLPVAVRAVEAGYSVVGLDVDEKRVAAIAAGDSPVPDISRERLTEALATGRFQPSTDPDDAKGFSHAIITVPTPLTEGAPDLSFIEAAAEMIAPHVQPGCCVVLESTTYPGTTEELVAPLLESASELVAGRDFHVGYSPERIDPGNRTWTFETTPKVVSGLTPACLDVVRGLYDDLVDETVPVSSPSEAELTKLLENTFRHVNIALVNELAMFANELGIDIWEAIDAATTKPFGYMRFTPGPGVGGHCLPVDPSYLSWRVKRSLGHAFRFVELANDVNDHMPDYVVQRLAAGLNNRELSVRGRRILVLGAAYKANTGDARETPALPIITQLLGLGATVRVADPHVAADHLPPEVERVSADPDEVTEADVVVLLVDHDEFDLEMVADRAGYALDTRRCLRAGPNVEVL